MNAAVVKRPHTDFIAIHCSGTKEDQDIGAWDIDRWHRQRGWLRIGYHYVIRRNGVLETGREEYAVGAHIAGFNERSIGICMIGGADANDRKKARANYTAEQWRTLEHLIRDLHLRYLKAVIQGHRDFPNVQKACPSFDVRTWLKKVRLYEMPRVSDRPQGVHPPQEGADASAPRSLSAVQGGKGEAGG